MELQERVEQLGAELRQVQVAKAGWRGTAVGGGALCLALAVWGASLSARLTAMEAAIGQTLASVEQREARLQELEQGITKAMEFVDRRGAAGARPAPVRPEDGAAQLDRLRADLIALRERVERQDASLRAEQRSLSNHVDAQSASLGEMVRESTGALADMHERLARRLEVQERSLFELLKAAGR